MNVFKKDVIKDRLYKLIGNTGYKLTPHSYVSGLDMANHLRCLFAQYNISCVMDIGANEGQYRNFLRRRCGYSGTIVSIEPVQTAFHILQKKAALDPNWMVFNWALGKKNETREMNVMKDTQFSSFLDPAANDIIKPDMANVIDHKEKVTVRRFDTVLMDLKDKCDFSCIYLKIDTQGNDLEVLEGAGSELSRVVALQSEVSVKPIYKGMPNYKESIERLNTLGFELTGLFSVSRDLLFRVIEFDCVAVNTQYALKRNALK